MQRIARIAWQSSVTYRTHGRAGTARQSRETPGQQSRDQRGSDAQGNARQRDVSSGFAAHSQDSLAMGVKPRRVFQSSARIVVARTAYQSVVEQRLECRAVCCSEAQRMHRQHRSARNAEQRTARHSTASQGNVGPHSSLCIALPGPQSNDLQSVATHRAKCIAMQCKARNVWISNSE